MKRMIVAVAIAALVSVAYVCVPDFDLKLPYEGYEPSDTGDGWLLSTPEAEGLNPGKIDEIYRLVFSETDYLTAASLLIVRNGKLVAEGYCRDKEDRDWPNAIQSATKSVTSLLTGIALESGAIDSLYRPVFDFIPEAFDDNVGKRSISLYDTLTMRSGLAFDNDEHTETLFDEDTPDSLKYVLSRPLEFTPGTHFNYSDGDPHLVSGAIQKVTGMSLMEFAGIHLFEPLGIADYLWERHGDGIVYGAVGLWLKSRDMAKIGQLCLQRGMWEGKQIVSSFWIDFSTQPHVAEEGGIYYGLYWWIRPDFEAYSAVGHGGQYIYVIPGKNLVIVLTAEPYTADIGVYWEDFEFLVAGIIDALGPEP
jgi:CubicO group peptidase (beta-lactamase class C family)